MFATQAGMLYTVFPTVLQHCLSWTDTVFVKWIHIFVFIWLSHAKKILAYFHLNYFIHFIKTRISQLTSTHSSIIMDRRAVSNFSRLMCCIPSVFSSNSWLRSQKRSPELQLFILELSPFWARRTHQAPCRLWPFTPQDCPAHLPCPLCCIYCSSGS